MVYIPFLLALATLPVALAATFEVDVGKESLLRFNPETLTAAPGDIVTFLFFPKNHTATQSSFGDPCSPLPGGFSSNFVPVATEGGVPPSFQYTVKDTNPVWVYCQQTGHCGKGMVFAINPPPDPSPNSFSAFQAKAMGTAATATSPAGTGYVTPPPPTGVTVTVTVTAASSTWTTTYLSYDGTPPPTPAAQPVDHKITVGANGQLAYSPSNISASIGDTVTFEFYPKNHTVTQSSFSAPCEALADTSADHHAGFKSGFQPVDSSATTFPTFQIKINDTAPIWGYCGQTGHCGKGMVFAINAVESGPDNFAAFQGLAQHINGTSTTSAGASPSATAKSAGTLSYATNLSAASFASFVLFTIMYMA